MSKFMLFTFWSQFNVSDHLTHFIYRDGKNKYFSNPYFIYYGKSYSNHPEPMCKYNGPPLPNHMISLATSRYDYRRLIQEIPSKSHYE